MWMHICMHFTLVCVYECDYIIVRNGFTCMRFYLIEFSYSHIRIEYSISVYIVRSECVNVSYEYLYALCVLQSQK